MSYSILEDNYKDLLRGQGSITNLFPTFYKRVTDVENAGGIRMTTMQPDRWTFKVASSTGDGSYELVANFVNLDDMIKKNVRNKAVWNKEGTGVDLRKLAYLVMKDTDLQLYCSCEAFQYWGSAYILTKRDSKYTDPEIRAPRIRNPNQYGRYCKHLAVLMNRLPLYTGTMASFIKKYHMDTVDKAVRNAELEKKRISKMKSFLGRDVDHAPPDKVPVKPVQKPKENPKAADTRAPNKAEEPQKAIKKPEPKKVEPVNKKPEPVKPDNKKDKQDTKGDTKTKDDKDARGRKETPPESPRKTKR